MINRPVDGRLGAIFGSGRSGTTWLGSIVSSSPEISYRFEPFHRLENQNSRISKAISLIRSESFSERDLSFVYDTLSIAYPECEKPPFFRKNFQLRAGRKLVWPLSRNNSVGSYFFKLLYTPKTKPMLVFKEVDSIDLLIQLVNKTEVPLVYILRHPCAVVSSTIKGQENSLMSNRRSVVQSLLAKHQPLLAEKYGDRIEELSVCEQEALLWLTDIERAFAIGRDASNVLFVVYEELTKYPLEIAKQVFDHLGLQMSCESIAFIEESTKQSSISRIKSGEVGVNSYFSVFRDPQQSRDRWKTEMSLEDRTKIMNIMQDSKAFATYTQQGFWD